MIEALIFDFDGVVVDSEPVHLACFQRVLAGVGVALSRDDYYSKYLGYDDHDCFMHVLTHAGRGFDEALLTRLTAEKTRLVQETFRHSIQPLPGAVELMREAHSAGVAVAICSGALRDEIILAGTTVGAMPLVDVLVAAQDVQHGKPDPEGYRKALRLLSERRPRPINPRACWVIEDSPAGIEAAKAAGCNVLAVLTSYDRPALAGADKIVHRLNEITLEGLAAR